MFNLYTTPGNMHWSKMKGETGESNNHTLCLSGVVQFQNIKCKVRLEEVCGVTIITVIFFQITILKLLSKMDFVELWLKLLRHRLA